VAASARLAIKDRHNARHDHVRQKKRRGGSKDGARSIETQRKGQCPMSMVEKGVPAKGDIDRRRRLSESKQSGGKKNCCHEWRKRGKG